jgi:tight adherence protein C
VSGTVLLAGGLAALGVGIATLVLTLVPGKPAPTGVAQALATIDHRYTRDGPDGGSRAPAPFIALPGWLRLLSIRLSPPNVGGSLQRRLNVAGNPQGWTPDRVLAVKGLGLLALAAFGALYGFTNPGLLILCAGLGAVIGFFLPDILLYNSGQKRQARIPQELPDALDMLTICVEAGLGFDAAMAQVARHTKGTVAAEFARVLQEMQIGKSRTEALRGMIDRTTAPELRAFVSALIQSNELGISVAHVLREQAKEMRVRRRQRAEEKAQKVPVKITFPLILCLFPALLIVVMGPGILQIAHSLFFR